VLLRAVPGLGASFQWPSEWRQLQYVHGEGCREGWATGSFSCAVPIPLQALHRPFWCALFAYMECKDVLRAAQRTHLELGAGAFVCHSGASLLTSVLECA
jgi:hypothetical protein